MELLFFIIFGCILTTQGHKFLIDRDMIAKKDGFKFNFHKGKGELKGMRFQSIGCWKDTWDRAIEPLEGRHQLLMDVNYKIREDPLRKCAIAALDNHLQIFALENSGQCFGDTAAASLYSRFGKASQCQDDGYGGPWSMQVYGFTGFEVKPKNGGYTKWSEWTKCSKTCGNGIKKRSRTCTEPSPANGGMDCSHLGPAAQTWSCDQACPGEQTDSYTSSLHPLSPITETIMTPKVSSFTNSQQSNNNVNNKNKDYDEDEYEDYDDDNAMAKSDEDETKSNDDVTKTDDGITKSDDKFSKAGNERTKVGDELENTSHDVMKVNNDVTNESDKEKNELQAAHDLLRAKWLSISKNHSTFPTHSSTREQHSSSREHVVDASLHENNDDDYNDYDDDDDDDDEMNEPSETVKDSTKINESAQPAAKRITGECICPAVVCLHLADSGVLIDNSNVTDMADLEEMKNFAKGLAAGFMTKPKDIQMGVIAAGSRSRVIVPFGKKLPIKEFNRRVDTIRRENGPSGIGQAFKRAEAYLLLKEKVALPPLLNDVVFVMESGDSDVDVHAPVKDLKSAGAKIVVIGVGKNAKLGKVASQADKTFMVPPGAGNAIVNAIISAVCKPDLMGKILPNPIPCPCMSDPTKKRTPSDPTSSTSSELSDQNTPGIVNEDSTSPTSPQIQQNNQLTQTGPPNETNIPSDQNTLTNTSQPINTQVLNNTPAGGTPTENQANLKAQQSGTTTEIDHVTTLKTQPGNQQDLATQELGQSKDESKMFDQNNTPTQGSIPNTPYMQKAMDNEEVTKGQGGLGQAVGNALIQNNRTSASQQIIQSQNNSASTTQQISTSKDVGVVFNKTIEPTTQNKPAISKQLEPEKEQTLANHLPVKIQIKNQDGTVLLDDTITPTSKNAPTVSKQPEQEKQQLLDQEQLNIQLKNKDGSVLSDESIIPTSENVPAVSKQPEQQNQQPLDNQVPQEVPDNDQDGTMLSDETIIPTPNDQPILSKQYTSNSPAQIQPQNQGALDDGDLNKQPLETLLYENQTPTTDNVLVTPKQLAQSLENQQKLNNKQYKLLLPNENNTPTMAHLTSTSTTPNKQPTHNITKWSKLPNQNTKPITLLRFTNPSLLQTQHIDNTPKTWSKMPFQPELIHQNYPKVPSMPDPQPQKHLPGTTFQNKAPQISRKKIRPLSKSLFVLSEKLNKARKFGELKEGNFSLNKDITNLLENIETLKEQADKLRSGDEKTKKLQGVQSQITNDTTASFKASGHLPLKLRISDSSVQTSHLGPSSELTSESSREPKVISHSEKVDLSSTNNVLHTGKPLTVQDTKPTQPIRSQNTMVVKPIVPQNTKPVQPITGQDRKPAQLIKTQNIKPVQPITEQDFKTPQPIQTKNTKPITGQDFKLAQPVTIQNTKPAEPIAAQNLKLAQPTDAENTKVAQSNQKLIQQLQNEIDAAKQSNSFQNTKPNQPNTNFNQANKPQSSSLGNFPNTNSNIKSPKTTTTPLRLTESVTNLSGTKPNKDSNHLQPNTNPQNTHLATNSISRPTQPFIAGSKTQKTDTQWPDTNKQTTASLQNQVTKPKDQFISIENELVKKKSSLPDCDINLGFILDGSASVEGTKHGNFLKMVNFVKDIIHEFTKLSRQVHVGTLVYSTKTTVVFTFGTKGTEEMIDKILDNVRYPGQGSLTGNALKVAWNTMFEPAPRGRKSVILLLTDGPSNDDVLRPSKWIKDRGVELFVIGLGKSYDKNQLTDMASGPIDKHVMIKDYDELRTSVQEVRNKLCGFSSGQILQIMSSPLFKRDDRLLGYHGGIKPNQCIIDVAFLLDGSRQVETNGEGNFQRQISFVKKAAKLLPISPDDVHVGVGLLGDAQTRVFPMNEHYTENAVQYELDHIQFPAAGDIQPQDVKAARQIMLNVGTRDVAPHVFVLMTDVSSLDSYRRTVREMRREGTEVVLFGVGSFSWKQELNIRSSVEGLVDQIVTLENSDEEAAVKQFTVNICKLSNEKRSEIPRLHWKPSEKHIN